MLYGYSGAQLYKDIYKYIHDTKKSEINIYHNKYLYNLVYLSKILKEFNNIFQLIKGINLLHTYKYIDTEKYKDWDIFYEILKKHKKVFIRKDNNHKYSEIDELLLKDKYMYKDRNFIRSIIMYKNNIHILKYKIKFGENI
jgi:hypothetical protein